MNISTDVEANKLHFDALFCTKRNFDLKKREMVIAGKNSVLYMIDGFLRSDVLEKIGLTIPTTLEELVAILPDLQMRGLNVYYLFMCIF